jgi:chromosome segregation ATPase
MLKKTGCLAAAVFVTVGAGAAMAGAADPVAAAQATIQKLVSDATTLHSTVLADAQKISADVQSLQGSTDRAAARQTLKADAQKIKADRAQLWPTVQADWAQLKTDLQAVRDSKTGKGQLKPLLQQAKAQLAQERDAVKTALQAAHQAAQGLRNSLKQSGSGSHGNGSGSGTTTTP